MDVEISENAEPHGSAPSVGAGDRKSSVEAELVAERAASLRAVSPSDAPSKRARDAEGGAFAPPRGTTTAVPHRGWLVAAVVAGLALSLTADVIAVVRLLDKNADRPAAAAPSAAPTGTMTVAQPTAATPTVSARPTKSTPTPARTSRAAASAAPTRSAATAPALAPAGKTSAPAGTITGSACATASAGLFNATFTKPFTWHHVFINADADTATGYRVPGASNGLGADYMVENDKLYRSTSRSWGWTAVGEASPLQSSAGGTFRWQVSLDVVGDAGETLAVIFNGSGNTPDAYTPVLTVGPC